MPLHCLPPGHAGHVSQIMGSSDHVHRLEELGLRQGVMVEMVQSGTPCIIRLHGGKLCFRENEALSVLVTLGELV
ncbi:FeoA family protein [Lignipirellula cremea]|nr:FeoA domain-containing protein [Lignipirellula cremea]